MPIRGRKYYSYFIPLRLHEVAKELSIQIGMKENDLLSTALTIGLMRIADEFKRKEIDTTVPKEDGNGKENDS